MQSNIQARGVNHLNKCRSRRPYRVMKKPDALHKINNFIHKDTEYKYFGCQNISSELFTVCFCKSNTTYLNMPYIQGFENYCEGELFKTEIEILKTKLI